MKELHSYWAYLVVIVLIITVLNAILGLKSKKEFTSKDLRLGLFTLIISHIQLLIGLGWYFMSPYNLLSQEDMALVMKTKELRLLVIEHPISMILAIALITIGWSKHKKQDTNKGKFKSFVVFYSIALLIILSRIPWSQWF